MSRAKTKEWKRITNLTLEWVKASYPSATVGDSWKYKDRMNNFLEFMNLTDKEFVGTYRRAKDRIEWAKEIGKKVIAFYNDRVQKGYATNSVRAEVSTIRAFCRDNCTTLILARKKIAKAKASVGEHEFSREELAKMFYVADVRDKAILSTAISLGFSVEDFSELPRNLIESLVQKATEQKIDFIGFNYERKKTGVHSRSHLTPDARSSLLSWFEYLDKERTSKGLGKSEWVFPNGNGNHLDEKTFNRVVKDLVQKANITVTGKIRFHLLRKFLMSSLSDALKSEFLVKRAVGKEIPVSDSTYLQSLDRQLDEKFHEVYDYIKLSGYANKNGLRIEELEQRVQKLEIESESKSLENATLLRILEYTIPKETLEKAIRELIAKGLVDKKNLLGVDFVTLPIPDLIKLLTQVKALEKKASEQPTTEQQPQA